MQGAIRRKVSQGVGADSTASNADIRAVKPCSVLVEDADASSRGSRTPPGTGSQLRVLDGVGAMVAAAPGSSIEGTTSGRPSRLSGTDYQRPNMSPATRAASVDIASPFTAGGAVTAASVAAVAGGAGHTGPSSIVGARVVNPAFMRLSQAHDVGIGGGGNGGGGALSSGGPRSSGASGGTGRTGSFIKRIIGLGGGSTGAGNGAAGSAGAPPLQPSPQLGGRMSLQGLPYDARTAGGVGVGGATSVPGTHTRTGRQPSAGMLVDVSTGGSDAGYLAGVVATGSTAGYGSGSAPQQTGASRRGGGHQAPLRSVSFRLEVARSPRGAGAKGAWLWRQGQEQGSGAAALGAGHWGRGRGWGSSGQLHRAAPKVMHGRDRPAVRHMACLAAAGFSCFHIHQSVQVYPCPHPYPCPYPRAGVSKLAPIISLMHERMKAAQAVQMTGQSGGGGGYGSGGGGGAGGGEHAASSRQAADLESVRMLQEVGKGGYGTVYR